MSAIKPADFGKRSHSGYPLIFGLFARMQLVEQMGSGIMRMNDLMDEVGLPLPEFTTECLQLNFRGGLKLWKKL